MHESGEMYLETIYVLSQKKAAVRSVDVAVEMGFSKPSVSRGIGLLKKGEFITVDDNGYITLTKTGLAYAKKIYERHTVLTELLVRFGVDEKTAAEDACRIEHIISEETFEAMKKHAESTKKEV